MELKPNTDHFRSSTFCARVGSLATAVLALALAWAAFGAPASAQSVPSSAAPSSAPAKSTGASGVAQAPGAQAAPAQPKINPDEVVLTVGDFKMTAADFEKMVDSLPPQFRNAFKAMGKTQFAQQYANLLILAMEGDKRNLDKSDEYNRMLEFDRKVLLAQLTMDQLASENKPTPQDVEEYYKANQDKYTQVHIRAIYIPFKIDTPSATGAPAPLATQPDKGKAQLTEEQAKDKALDLKHQIESGGDMAALAKTESQHPTAANGGDFGWVQREQLAPQLADAVFALQPGQLSDPVRDRFGYFLFRLEEKRTQPLAQVQQNIESNVANSKIEGGMKKVEQSYPVTLNPKYFPATPAPAEAVPPPEP